MSKKPYILITSTEYGDIRIVQMTADKVRECVGECEDGPSWITEECLAKQADPMYWSNRFLLIKGEVVVPIPKTTVTEWDI